MSFPTTPVLDDAHRADQGPPPSSSWTTNWVGSAAGLKIVSNTIRADAANGNGYWNSIFPADSEMWIRVAHWSNSSDARLGIRLSSIGSTNGYFAYWDSGSNFSIFRLDGGAGTALGSVSTSVVDGDVVGLRAVGSLISLYRVSFGSLSPLLQVADAVHPGSGFIGLGMGDSTMTVSAFGGGAAQDMDFVPALNHGFGR